MKDLEEIFMTVALHLLLQGEKSMPPAIGICRYRGPDGLACAIGALISDEHYSVSLEGRAANDVLVEMALSKSGFGVDNIGAELLHLLQSVHDVYAPEQWCAKLEEIEAKYFGNHAHKRI